MVEHDGATLVADITAPWPAVPVIIGGELVRGSSGTKQLMRHRSCHRY